MFSSDDVEWDERTEHSEWEVHIKGDNHYIALARLTTIDGTGANKIEWMAQSYRLNEGYIPATIENVELPNVYAKTPTAVVHHLVEFILRKNYVRRMIKNLTPEEQEMMFNVVNELIDEDFNSHIIPTPTN